jgi:hypothetical protein
MARVKRVGKIRGVLVRGHAFSSLTSRKERRKAEGTHEGEEWSERTDAGKVIRALIIQRGGPEFLSAQRVNSSFYRRNLLPFSSAWGTEFRRASNGLAHPSSRAISRIASTLCLNYARTNFLTSSPRRALPRPNPSKISPVNKSRPESTLKD